MCVSTCVSSRETDESSSRERDEERERENWKKNISAMYSTKLSELNPKMEEKRKRYTYPSSINLSRLFVCFVMCTSIHLCAWKCDLISVSTMDARQSCSRFCAALGPFPFFSIPCSQTTQTHFSQHRTNRINPHLLLTT